MTRFRHLSVLAAAGAAIVSLMTLSTSPVGAAPQSQTFDTPGTSTFVVPDGVTSVVVEALGAAGGAAAEGGSGGGGGSTTATIAVTPGESLQINVGGQGGDGTSVAGGAGGTNGGGAGGLGIGGGGGGGASDVRRGGTDLTDRVVVAGGGGGAGGNYGCVNADGGSGGGPTPTAGESPGLSPDDSEGGFPGGEFAGGAGGDGGNGPAPSGSAGSLGTGGDGAEAPTAETAGGGGGGGYFGGGGAGAAMPGGDSGGGGGGSAYAVGTAVEWADGVNDAGGSVILSWEAVPATTTTTAAPTTTAPAGPSATYGTDPGAGVLSLTTSQGERVTLSSAGWAGASPVTATLFSDPVQLGVVTTDAAGAFVQTFLIPANTPVGAHRIELTGTSAAGTPAVVVLALTVTARAGAVAAPNALSFVC